MGSPWVFTVIFLTGVALVSVFKMDRTWVHRLNGFPWMMTLSVSGGILGAAIALFAIGPRWALAPALVATFPIAVELAHRLSKYRPATATIALPHWSGAERDEVRRILEEHFRECRLQVLDPAGWRGDVVAQGKLHGTVTGESSQVPHMALATIDTGKGGLEITLLVDNVDPVLSDTGESENCRKLLLAIAKRFAEPPFAEEGKPLPDLELPPMF